MWCLSDVQSKALACYSVLLSFLNDEDMSFKQFHWVIVDIKLIKWIGKCSLFRLVSNTWYIPELPAYPVPMTGPAHIVFPGHAPRGTVPEPEDCG